MKFVIFVIQILFLSGVVFLGMLDLDLSGESFWELLSGGGKFPIVYLFAIVGPMVTITSYFWDRARPSQLTILPIVSFFITIAGAILIVGDF